MRAMMSAASTGKSPMAVSPESMTQSVPSRTAFATSLASARVGRGDLFMDSSICVAVMTNFPAKLQRPIMTFCAMKTCSGGISMPKSPLATMIPSLAWRMASKFVRPSPFSILEMSRGGSCPSLQFSLSSFRTSSTLSASWTKDKATKSRPLGRANSRRSYLSFSDKRGNSTRTPGMLQFFLLPIAQSFSTVPRTRPSSASSTDVTLMLRVPSAMRMACPTFTSFGNLSQDREMVSSSQGTV
mmetsp:Transcript_52189/g.161988  ORF Transcript_52189/g.161988 Transcript_52189/m.161988 type:complete len:242 (+) Transcript_52189:537-1262(+)